VQKWWGSPCFQVNLEKDANLDEVVKAVEEAYTRLEMEKIKPSSLEQF
jgi:hypothetical protein